jgi:hypothetical protein
VNFGLNQEHESTVNDNETSPGNSILYFAHGCVVIHDITLWWPDVNSR